MLAFGYESLPMAFGTLTHTIHELVIDASLMMNEQNVQYQVKSQFFKNSC